MNLSLIAFIISLTALTFTIFTHFQVKKNESLRKRQSNDTIIIGMGPNRKH